ncbi:MAG: Gfo/Idh/MocA family oxidoreductase [Thermoproteota archaeon]
MSSLRRIGVAILGYAFMCKAHSHAFKSIPHFFYPPPAIPELVVVYGRTEEKVKEAAANYGFKKYVTDWRKAINDPEVEIVDNCLPNNMHLEPTLRQLRKVSMFYVRNLSPGIVRKLSSLEMLPEKPESRLWLPSTIGLCQLSSLLET